MLKVTVDVEAYGIFLTSVLLKKPESFCFRLLPVLFCPHLDPKTAVFDITYLSYATEIDFTTRDLCLRTPNAIPLRDGDQHIVDK